MRMVVCGECKKRYDFDRDDFCPRCGAFNPPEKQWTVDNFGNVVRVDGINERNHSGSFVHAEVHREKAIRKIKGLDRGGIKSAAVPQSGKKRAVPSSRKTGERGKKEAGLWIGAILAAVGLLLEILFG